MEMPLISVIVPVYNVKPFLGRCLQSLAAQTHTPIEFLLIDDGSTDGSGVLCREFAEKDSRFRYIRQENAGVSAARNLGLQEAKGRWLGFCDSDDWVEPDLYETLYRLASENGADISVVAFALEDGSAPEADEPEYYAMDGIEAVIEMHKAQKFAGQMCNKLICRRLLEGEAFPTDIAIYEDMLLMGRLFEKAQKVVYQKLHKYHYVIHPGSALNRGLAEKHWTVQPACCRLLQQMERLCPANRDQAVATLLMANVHLLNKLQDGKVMTQANFDRAMDEIRAYETPGALALLPAGCRYQIAAAKRGRLVYGCYRRLIQNELAQKAKNALRRLLGKGASLCL